jgi:hypothetical protein
VITASTNFTFLKEGNSGTNGTAYTCRIVLADGTVVDRVSYTVDDTAEDTTTDSDKESTGIALKL